MPEAHLPRLDEYEGDPRDTGATADSLHDRSRRRRLLRLGLEVALIAAGVFLGLMGEQWRENASHRELAQSSLRRFQAEIARNRTAVVGNRDYHVRLKRNLDAVLVAERAHRPPPPIEMHGVGPVFFERTAWDLALATQALAYVEPSMAFALSRAYSVQQDYVDMQRMILQSTIYGRSRTQDPIGYVGSIADYLGDVQYSTTPSSKPTTTCCH